MSEQVKKNLDRRYFPMLVSEVGGDRMPIGEDREVWKKYDSLSPEKKDLLISLEIAEKILYLERAFNLSVPQERACAILIRKIIFDEISLSQAQQEVFRLLQDHKAATDVIAFIRNEILTIRPSKNSDGPVYTDKRESISSTKTMSLLQALATYHNLGQQQITGEKIKLKSQAEPVRPTILNWLRYYRSELGIGYHNAVERGEFLYQSTNGRKLSPEERERINLVLKSIEEDLPLDVDPERQQIIFPKAALSAPSPAPRSPQISELAKPERISPVAVPAEVKPKFSAPRFASRPTLSHVPSQPSSEPSKQREMLKKQARPAAPSPDQSSAKDFSFVPASWKRSPRAIPVATGHLRFTAPHVFPVEHDQKESARETGQTPASGNAAVPRAPIPPVQPNKPPLSKAESDRAKAFAQPPQAPKRDPAPVPSVKPASGAPYRGPSRFNITPVGFTDDDEETVENT